MNAKTIFWMFVFFVFASFVCAQGSVWTGALSPSTVSMCGEYSDQATITASNVWNAETIQLEDLTAVLIIPDSSDLNLISSESVNLGDVAGQSKSNIDPSWVIECNNSIAGTFTLYVNYTTSNGYNGSSIDQATTEVTTYADVDSDAPLILSHHPGEYVNTQLIELYVETNENANCRYSTSDVSYDSMSSTFSITGSTEHNRTLSGLTEEQHTYYIRCEDANGNKMSSSYAVSFTVDKTLPVITSHEPEAHISGSTTNIKVVTNEYAKCRYSSIADKDYENMENALTSVYSLEHSKPLSGLSSQPYTYYVKCIDKAGNDMVNDYEISFEQDLPPSAEIELSVSSPLKPGTLEVTVTTSEDVQYKPILKYTIDGSTTDVPLFGSGNDWSGYMIISSGDEGVGSFSFTATDLNGNEGTEITDGSVFIVDSNAPSTPIDLAGKSYFNGDIDLRWYHDGEDVSGYNIYRSSTPGVSITDYFDNCSSKSYEDNSAKPGNTYYYAVSAVDGAGNEGQLSLEIEVVSIDEEDEDDAEDGEDEESTQEEESISEGLDVDLHYKVDNKVEDIKNLITDVEDAKDTMLKSNEDISKMLGFDDIYSEYKDKLENLKSDSENLKNRVMTQSELNSELSKINVELASMRKEIPVMVDIDDESKETYDPDSLDIEEAVEEYLKSRRMSNIESSEKQDFIEEITAMQANFMVENVAKELKIKYLDGEKEYKILIEKNIELKDDSEELILIETIPKSIAEDVSEISFSGLNYKVINSDPVVKIEYDDPGKSVKISYVVNNKVDSAKGIKTIFVKDYNIERSESKEENNKFTGAVIGDKIGSSFDIVKDNLSTIALLGIVAWLLFVNYFNNGGSIGSNIGKNTKGFGQMYEIKSKIKDYFDTSRQLKLINGKRLKDLNDLYSYLNSIDNNVFRFHQQNNDFSYWTGNVLGFKQFASKIGYAKDQKEMQRMMIDHFRR